MNPNDILSSDDVTFATTGNAYPNHGHLNIQQTLCTSCYVFAKYFAKFYSSPHPPL